MKKNKRVFRTLALLLMVAVFLSSLIIAASAVDYSATTIKASGTSRVEGENWMAGGQGVAFYERTYQTDPRAYASPRGQRPADTKDESKFVPQSQAWTGASNGMMLGWMDANEWVRYEINVKEAGTYQVGLLLGTGYNNVIIDVYLDANPDGGTLLGSIEVICNGFYNMMLQSLGDISLPEGNHTLKLLVRHAKGLGGLNLVGVDVDYIQFTRKQLDEPTEPSTEPSTEPPATQPPATQPPTTEPPATQPPATEPPATEPPTTQPSATEPPATEPSATEPAPSDSNEVDPLMVAVIVVSAVLVLAVAGLGIYLVVSNKKSSK